MELNEIWYERVSRLKVVRHISFWFAHSKTPILHELQNELYEISQTVKKKHKTYVL
jgi:hypothetical protein